MSSEFKNFLETSSIHGILHIAQTAKYQRLLWTIIVLCGFLGAGLLIRQSFQSWSESPVRTTIETLPISQLRFPKVSVCPPRNTFTNLNYDLVLKKAKNITAKSRQDLFNFFLELEHDRKFEEVIDDVDLLTNENRYQEWYNGYTELTLSNQMQKTGPGPLVRVPWYKYSTAAPYGNISSRHFGEKFNISAIKKKVVYSISISFQKVPIDHNLTIYISIRKETFPLREPDYDRIKILNFGYLQAEGKSFSFHIPMTGKYGDTSIFIERQIDDKELDFLGKYIKPILYYSYRETRATLAAK